MSGLFDVNLSDIRYFNDNIKGFLPDSIIDIHTHVWRGEFMTGKNENRSVNWPSLVAKENPIEDLLETYRLLFPGKRVTPMIFSQPETNLDINKGNGYITECAAKYNLPALLLSKPEWTAEDFDNKLKGFLGAKVYLNFAPPHIPVDEIEIFDFAPPHQLEILNKHGKILMLHIPRNGRLKDPVNLSQMLEIERRYPDIRLIIAHVGRAYCDEDIGNAFEVLKNTENMLFDISANTNYFVFEKLIKTVGPKRILFGSDMPILRMRCRRVTENWCYVNLVPKGIYGDLSGDRHMRETDEELTFFIYEEIAAFLKAAEKCGLNKTNIEDVFYNNADMLIQEINKR
ncbi:MAG: amidohydrolase family protein [Clostridiales bacterium]|nr:amidohydrolase family protein [Clostridiales bacterium]